MRRLTHPYPPLTDGFLTLRAPLEADDEAVAAACRDPEIARWTNVPENYTLEDARAFRRASLERTEAGTAVDLLGFLADGRLAGSFGAPALDRPTATAELGYWVAPDARGQGVAARGVHLLARWLAEAQGFRTFELLVHRDNAPSRRVAEKAGFPDTGERRPRPRQPEGVHDPEPTFIVYARSLP